MVITITKTRLHQVAAAGDLPPAAPRRRRRDRDGHEGRRLHRAPLRVLDARLPAVLLQPRQGLPLEGLRAAGGARTAKGRALVNVLPLREGERIQSVLVDARLHRGPRTSSSPRASGMVKKTEFLAYNTPIKADGIIAINIRDDDELVAVRRTSGDDEIIMVSRAGPGRALPRVATRARWAATPAACAAWTSSQQGQRGPRDGRRARRHGAARRHRERLRQAHADRPSTARPTAAPRASRRSRCTEREGRRSPARSSCASTRSSCSSPQNGMVQRTGGARASAAGPRRRRACELMNMRDDDVVSRRRARGRVRGRRPPRRSPRTARAARAGDGESPDPVDETPATAELPDPSTTTASDGRHRVGSPTPPGPTAGRRMEPCSHDPSRGRRSGGSGGCCATLRADQRKEVVRTLSDSSCGTLEVTGR